MALSCPAPKPQLRVGGPGEAETSRGRFSRRAAGVTGGPFQDARGTEAPRPCAVSLGESALPACGDV